jgi:hypothetical protein
VVEKKNFHAKAQRKTQTVTEFFFAGFAPLRENMLN